MRNFLYKVTGVLVILLLCNSILPVVGLYRLHKHYRYIPTGIVKFFKHEGGKASDVLVIGCSNLQHNIDIRKIQQNTDGIDFLYFSASQSSTFLTYLADAGFLKKYKHIILYAPYQMMEKNSFLNCNDLNYQGFASFEYTRSVIRHNPAAFFYDWNKYCDSVDLARTYLHYTKFVSGINDCEMVTDPFVDSLNQPGTSFSNCNEPFIHLKHRIVIPRFSEEDIAFVNSIPGPGQTINVIYIPIPSIQENLAGLKREKAFFERFPKALNRPETMDSTYFYDQWYHLNKCGKIIETEKLMSILIKYKAGIAYLR